MLHLTHHDQFTILAIDPGLHHIGLSVYKVQANPPSILSISAFTLHSHRVVDTSGLDDDDYIERVRIRHSMLRAFKGVVIDVMPDIAVSESPFFDRRKPGSFAILTEVMTGLFDTVVEVNPLIRFSTIAPQSVKQVLGVAGQKGKEVVIEAMAGFTEITDALDVDLNDLDEHGVDATGVGFAYYRTKSGLFPDKQK